MLVLVRKKNEGVHVGDFGRVVVIEIRGDKVRLGFQFDQAVPVHRDEVKAAIDRKAKRPDTRPPATGETDAA